MTHPYSIYIWQPNKGGGGSWIEPYLAYTEQHAIYIANLIFRDSKGVIKVVRFGVNIVCFPDKETVKRIDLYIEQQKEKQKLQEDR